MANDAPDWTSAVRGDEQPVTGFPANVAQDGVPHDLGPFTIPPGAQFIAFGFPQPLRVNSVAVTGNQSGIAYAPVTVNISGGKYTIAVHSKLDTSVEITIGLANVGGTMAVNAVWGFYDRVVVIDHGEPSAMFISRDVGGLQSGTVDSAGHISMAVTQQFAAPAVFQAANVGGAVGVGAINAGATFTLIAAGGITVVTYLRKIQVKISAVAGVFGTFECPSGTVRGNWNGALNDTYDMDWDWLNCGVNAAVLIRNTSGVNSGAFNGHATANQT